MSDKVNLLNYVTDDELNAGHSATIRTLGNTKILTINSTKGIKTTDVIDMYFSVDKSELFPSFTVRKWVVLRETVTAYLEITPDGHVILSRASADIPKDTYIAITETYSYHVHTQLSLTSVCNIP